MLQSQKQQSSHKLALIVLHYNVERFLLVILFIFINALYQGIIDK